MHRLSFLQATIIDAPLLLSSASMATVPALRLGSPPRSSPPPPRWLRCGGGGVGEGGEWSGAEGMACSVEALARRGGGGESESENEEEEEKRRGRAGERRLRGGGSAAAAAAAAGSGELLSIPGVGPRNQRKLVDNGFEGVAQLKQLYRDKVRALRVFCTALICSIANWNSGIAVLFGYSA